MVDYKKYIKVLEILNSDNRIWKDNICVWFKNWDTEMKQPSKEEIASAICELFDTQKVITGNNIYNSTPKLYDFKPVFTDWWTTQLDLNRVACECTDKTDCEWYN